MTLDSELVTARALEATPRSSPINRAVRGLVQPAVRTMTINPATRHGLAGTRGSTAPGYDADIVAFDPYMMRKVDVADLRSNAGWSPCEGFEAPGQGEVVRPRSNGRRR